MTANTIPVAEVLRALGPRRRVTRSDAEHAVADLANFDYNRSGSARWRTSPPETGILRPESLDSFRAHVDGAPLLYVVFSYETPIAVYAEGRGWWLENSKYSATTTTHQGFTLRGIRQRGSEPVTLVQPDAWPADLIA